MLTTLFDLKPFSEEKKKDFKVERTISAKIDIFNFICSCGNLFGHRSDDLSITCPLCNTSAYLYDIVPRLVSI